MKRISFFLTLTLLVLSFGLVSAQQEITIDHIDGYYSDGGNDMLTADADVTIYLRIVNYIDPDCKWSPSGAFVIKSDDGAEWGGLALNQEIIRIDTILAGVLEDTIYFENLFSQLFLEHINVDGVGGDTVGFGGVVMPANDGLYEGMDVVTFSLDFHPTAASAGKTICIDHGGQVLQGFEWAWSPVDTDNPCGAAAVEPGFTPVCYGIGTPPDFPPVMDIAPTSKSGSHCDPLSFDIVFSDPDPGAGPGPDDVTVAASFGDLTNVTGTSATWTWTGSLSDVGSALQVELVLTEADNPLTNTTVVNIVMENSAPEFISGCDQTVFAQTLVKKDVPFDGLDDCDGDPMTFSVIDAGGITGAMDFNGKTLEITADAGDVGEYTVVLGISDGVDDGAECSITVKVSAGALYGIEIEKTHDTFQGGFVDVAINLTGSPPSMGGFNLLIAYDASALTFQGATEGYAIGEDGCEWEYFTYRYGADGNCNGGCPSGLVRLVGIAETNNGISHPVPNCDIEIAIDPDVLALDPEDTVSVLANMSFLVTNDRTLECQYVPIRFFWIECGDNTVTDADGTRLYIAATVKEYFGDGANLMDTYSDAVLPTFVGPMDCYDSAKVGVLADIDFRNGGVDIVCAEDIDDRGDLNLDGLAYTIADAVMYSNYFVDGLSALYFDPVTGFAASIAASDVNADGLALTVADLVYLIRVVVGDAQPYPKVSPMAANLTVGSSLSVDVSMGAAFVVLAGDQTPALEAGNMEMKFSFDGDNTRVLVWSQTGESFIGEFLSNVGTVISTELAAADGSPVMAKNIPENFALGQNYPNPFNPTTSIALSLPVASDFTLTIYNVTGQVVETINGSADAGFQTVEWDASSNASGVYFYKLTAGNFTDTKKMVLLK